MPYTTNPNLPKLRAKAVDRVRNGKSMREVARHLGFEPSTISRWVKKAPLGGVWKIPTESSRPKHHPKEISDTVKQRIYALRAKLNGRCAEGIREHLKAEGIKVSVRSVNRVLDRAMLLRKRRNKKRHYSIDRPYALNPGDLVQVDTVHLMVDEKQRLYVYTLIDVCSRWAYAEVRTRANAVQSVSFVKNAKSAAPFPFRCLQSDNGSEFSKHFTEKSMITHRHSRVRRPNDNAHLERFNRTLREECLRYLPVQERVIRRALSKYLRYYNVERYHLNLKTPLKLV